jgi:uncharacterized protein (UPF0210 family)
MEITLIKKIIQQASKAICFSILALAMASCTNSQDVDEAKEAADKAKKEAQEAKEETEKIKKDLGDKITRLETASTPGELAAMKDKLDSTNSAYILGDVYTKTEVDAKLGDYEKTADIYTKLGDYEKTLAVNTKLEDYAESNTVYTWEETLVKINVLNTKIFNARDDMNVKFTADAIED